jgi:ABC-type transport system involved in multi-copper enzyme maturation permease subunit
MSIRVIIGLTVREAGRRKVLWGLLVLSALFLAFYSLGLGFVHSRLVESGGLPRGLRFITLDGIYNFWMTMALYAANFLIVMMAVLISVDTLAGEIASGTIQSIAVKPLRRHDILLGKWLGFALMLAAYTAVLVGGTLIVTRLIAGYTPPHGLAGMALMLLEGLTLLSVSFLGGTRLSTLANGVFGFGLFGLAFIGGWIEQIGSFPAVGSQAAVELGHLASLLMPSEALWRLAASNMSEGSSAIPSPFTTFSTPDPGAVAYALVYMAAVILLAVFSFRRRDL